MLQFLRVNDHCILEQRENFHDKYPLVCFGANKNNTVSSLPVYKIQTHIKHCILPLQVAHVNKNTEATHKV